MLLFILENLFFHALLLDIKLFEEDIKPETFQLLSLNFNHETTAKPRENTDQDLFHFSSFITAWSKNYL